MTPAGSSGFTEDVVSTGTDITQPQLIQTHANEWHKQHWIKSEHAHLAHVTAK